MDDRRRDRGFRTRIPRPQTHVLDARERRGKENDARSGVKSDGDGTMTTKRVNETTTEQTTPKRTKREVSATTRGGMVLQSCARSTASCRSVGGGEEVAVRVTADARDEALEALLGKNPRGKDKFDKVGKAKACDAYLGELKPAVRELMGRMMDVRVELANCDAKHERAAAAIRESLRVAEEGKANVEIRLREAIEEQERLEERAKKANEGARSSERAKGEAER